MTEQKVNIVSRDEAFSRILELECEYMEIACSVSATPLEGFSVYVIDCALQNIARPSGSLILISKTPNDIPTSLLKRANAVLERPFLMSDFRKEIRNIFVSSETKPNVKLSLDAQTQSVCIGNNCFISLTPAEYIILCELQKRAGHPLSKTDAASLLNGEKNSNLYEVHICSLRKKLAAKTDRNYIYTLRGKGYYLKED